MNNKHKTSKRVLGDQGEDLVCEFLMKQGYEIVARNYLKPYGEIDVVAVKDGKYHFIEVKSVSHEMKFDVPRGTEGEYRPEDNLHPWKLRRLARVIQAYLVNKRLFDAEWQFDVALVYINNVSHTSQIEYLEDIVL